MSLYEELQNEVQPGSRLTIVFSYLGHLYIHLCTAFYFVIVLALEADWQLPYHELIELWTLGSLLVGVAALPAGMLSDRLGAGVMMALFFLGMGGSTIGASLAASPRGLMLWLSGIGLFAAIYHPVGIPWLVRSSGGNRGKVLGVNGIFGTLGSALSGIAAGALIDAAGWRAAFLVPGVVCFVTGSVLVFYLARGLARGRVETGESESRESAEDSRRVFVILLATMFLAGLIFHSTQTSLPKLFEQRHQGLVGEGAFGVGVLVALVYGVAGAMQLVGGYLADRFPLKWVYAGAILLQVPTLWLAAILGGAPLMLVATFMVMANAAALPAESMLLARHTPENRHGLVFGLKFVLSFGAAPLAVQLVALVSGRTGEFYWLFSLLALCALMASLFAFCLPGERLPATAVDRPAPAS